MRRGKARIGSKRLDIKDEREGRLYLKKVYIQLVSLRIANPVRATSEFLRLNISH